MKKIMCLFVAVVLFCSCSGVAFAEMDTQTITGKNDTIVTIPVEGYIVPGEDENEGSNNIDTAENQSIHGAEVKSPKTGDSSEISIFFLLSVMAIATIGILLRFRKREQKN